MHGRKMTAADFDQVRALAPSGTIMPELGNNVLAGRVVEADGQIVVAAAARLSVMAHLYLDHRWNTPQFRLEALRLLHREMRQELREKGIEHAHAELEPSIERAFGRRLVRDFGWDRARLKQFILEI